MQRLEGVHDCKSDFYAYIIFIEIFQLFILRIKKGKTLFIRDGLNSIPGKTHLVT